MEWRDKECRGLLLTFAEGKADYGDELRTLQITGNARRSRHPEGVESESVLSWRVYLDD